MRLIGIVLVVVGAVALGAQAFGHSFPSAGDTGPTPYGREPSAWSSLVTSGIALTAGLLLLAAAGGRKEA